MKKRKIHGDIWKYVEISNGKFMKVPKVAPLGGSFLLTGIILQVWKKLVVETHLVKRDAGKVYESWSVINGGINVQAFLWCLRVEVCFDVLGKLTI